MTPNPKANSTAEFMAALWAQVAAQDAAQNTRLEAIMTPKPVRARKVEPPPSWIVKSISAAQKDRNARSSKSKLKKARKGKP